MKTLLIIDDDPDVGEFISEVGRLGGYETVHVTNFDDFCRKLTPDVSMIMVDLVMPGKDGIEILRYLGECGCRAGIVLISGFDRRVLSVSEDLAVELGLCVLGRLQKPIRMTELEAFLTEDRHLMDKPRLRAELPLAIDDEEVKRAIVDNRFVVHYQPQVEIKTQRPVGVEALVRWNHPVYGLVAPYHFLEKVERLGLIDRLTWQVVNKTLSEIPLLSKQGWPLSISFNLSAKSLDDLRIPEVLSGWAESFNVNPSAIVVEITESGLVSGLVKALDILTRLRVKGFRLSIDDFGTGYSMMQQLRRVPATELKIDKSFVGAMLGDDASMSMVCKTIELGHALGMEVLAEGVESEQQFQKLRELGCDIVQGYLFSRALPILGLLNWLRHHRAMLKVTT